MAGNLQLSCHLHSKADNHLDIRNLAINNGPLSLCSKACSHDENLVFAVQTFHKRKNDFISVTTISKRSQL